MHRMATAAFSVDFHVAVVYAFTLGLPRLVRAQVCVRVCAVFFHVYVSIRHLTRRPSQVTSVSVLPPWASTLSWYCMLVDLFCFSGAQEAPPTRATINSPPPHTHTRCLH
jgi:hypothetical protein